MKMTAPSRGKSARRVPAKSRNNNEPPRQIPRPPRDEADDSQSGDFTRACQRFLQRNAFDLARFDLRDAAVSFGFPRFRHGRLQSAVPRDHDAVNQFRHDLARHLAGFFDNLIQCHWHGASFAHEPNFDKGEAGERVLQKFLILNFELEPF